MDWALSAVAAVIEPDGQKVGRATVVLGGVAPIPWIVEAANQLLSGKPVTDDTVSAVADAAVADAEPLEHNGYKVPLTRALVKRAINSLV